MVAVDISDAQTMSPHPISIPPFLKITTVRDSALVKLALHLVGKLRNLTCAHCHVNAGSKKADRVGSPG